MARQVIDFDLLGNIIVVAMYEEFVNDGLIDFTVAELSELIPYFPQNAIRLQMIHLVEGPLVDGVPTRSPTEIFANLSGRSEQLRLHGFHLTRDGVNVIAGWPQEIYDTCAAYIVEGADSLADNDEASGNWELDDSAWEPLPIDRATPEYEEAVKALDDAAEKIETDNGYATNVPEERDNVVWSLRQGIVAIREMAPSLAHVRALIMVPLNSAIKTLKESVPGVAAMIAREAIKEWIKSLFR